VLSHPDAILDQLRQGSSEPEDCWPEVSTLAAARGNSRLTDWLEALPLLSEDAS
jgi:hypothetical protein